MQSEQYYYYYYYYCIDFLFQLDFDIFSEKDRQSHFIIKIISGYCLLSKKTRKLACMQSPNLKLFEYEFTLYVHSAKIDFKFPCTLYLTWKAGNVSCQTSNNVAPIGGTIPFRETIVMQCPILFDEEKRVFLEKKSILSLYFVSSSKTAEGKLAGILSFYLSKCLNTSDMSTHTTQYINLKQNISTTDDYDNGFLLDSLKKYPIERCPDKSSSCELSLSARFLRQLPSSQISELSFSHSRIQNPLAFNSPYSSLAEQQANSRRSHHDSVFNKQQNCRRVRDPSSSQHPKISSISEKEKLTARQQRHAASRTSSEAKTLEAKQQRTISIVHGGPKLSSRQSGSRILQSSREKSRIQLQRVESIQFKPTKLTQNSLLENISKQQQQQITQKSPDRSFRQKSQLELRLLQQKLDRSEEEKPTKENSREDSLLNTNFTKLNSCSSNIISSISQDFRKIVALLIGNKHIEKSQKFHRINSIMIADCEQIQQDPSQLVRSLEQLFTRIGSLQLQKKKAIEIYDERIKNHENKIRELEDENRVLQKKVDQSDASLRRYQQQQLRVEEQQKDRQKNEVERYLQGLETHSQKIVELQQALQRQEERAVRFMKQKNDLSSMNSLLRIEIQNLKMAKDSAVRKIAQEYQKEIEELRKSGVKQDSTLKQYQETIANLKGMCQQLHNANQVLENENTMIVIDLNKRVSEFNQQLEVQRMKAKEIQGLKNLEIELVHSELAEAQRQLREVLGQVARLKVQKEQAKVVFSQKMSQVVRLNSCLSQNLALVQKIRSDNQESLQRINGQHQSAIKSLQDRLQQHKQLETILRNDLENLEKNLEAAYKANIQKDEQYAQTRKELEAAQLQLSQHIQRIKVAECELAQKKDFLADVAKELELRKDEQAVLRRQLSSRQSMIIEIENELILTKTYLNEKDLIIAYLQEREKPLHEEKRQLDVQLEATLVELISIRQLYAEAMENWSIQRQKAREQQPLMLRTSDDGLIGVKGKEKLVISDQNFNADGTNQKQNTERDRQISLLEQKIRQQEAQLIQLHEQVFTRESDENAVWVKIQEADEKITEMQRQIHILEMQSAQQNSLILSLTAEKSELMNELQANKIQRNNDCSIQQLSKKIQELELREKNASANLLDLQTRFSQLQKAYQQTKSLEEDYRHRVVILQQQLQEKSASSLGMRNQQSQQTAYPNILLSFPEYQEASQQQRIQELQEIVMGLTGRNRELLARFDSVRSEKIHIQNAVRELSMQLQRTKAKSLGGATTLEQKKQVLASLKPFQSKVEQIIVMTDQMFAGEQKQLDEDELRELAELTSQGSAQVH